MQWFVLCRTYMKDSSVSLASDELILVDREKGDFLLSGSWRFSFSPQKTKAVENAARESFPLRPAA